MSLGFLETRSKYWAHGPLYSEAILFPKTFFVGMTLSFGKPFWIAIGAGIVKITVGIDSAHIVAHMPPQGQEKDEAPTVVSKRLIAT